MNKPITIPKDSTLDDAIKELTNKKISRLVVSEGENHTSILTEKDLGMFLLNDNSERNLDQISISEIIQPLQSIDSDATLKECAQTMIENAIGSLAIKKNNSIIGIITKTDLVKYFANNFSGKKIVGEYATLFYAWEHSDSLLHKVVKKMVDEKISRIILKNKNELPEGILTFRDLFRIALNEGNEKEIADNTDPLISIVFTRKGFLSETGFGSTTTAKQIMTDKIISVRYDDDMVKACNLILENYINAVGVLSNKGRLIGILSKTDVTRAIAFVT